MTDPGQAKTEHEQCLVLRDALKWEYELLQSKIDSFGRNKFLIRGSSFTISAGAAAYYSNHPTNGAVAVTACLVLIFAFHIVATQQELHSRDLGKRASFVEDKLLNINTAIHRGAEMSLEMVETPKLANTLNTKYHVGDIIISSLLPYRLSLYLNNAKILVRLSRKRGNRSGLPGPAVSECFGLIVSIPVILILAMALAYDRFRRAISGRTAAEKRLKKERSEKQISKLPKYVADRIANNQKENTLKMLASRLARVGKSRSEPYLLWSQLVLFVVALVLIPHRPPETWGRIALQSVINNIAPRWTPTTPNRQSGDGGSGHRDAKDESLQDDESGDSETASTHDSSEGFGDDVALIDEDDDMEESETQGESSEQ